MKLLGAACSEHSVESLADLTVGQRDGLLLRLRASTFGPQLVAVTPCAACGARIELTFQTADLLRQPAAAAMEEVCLDFDGYELRLRPPSTRDVMAVLAEDPKAARLRLLERCVPSAHYRGSQVTAGQLPERVVEAVEQALAEADPHSEIHLAVGCPACGSKRTAAFDVVSFFWAEIEAWAGRILREVHTLALAYGWAENEILALSPLRRRCYLDLVGV
jgi:hypothetical protein